MSGTETRWWWIRHAPVVGCEGIVYGDSEVPCDTSDTGRFRALAERLPMDAVWVSSPLGRARATASALGEAGLQGPAPLLEPDLREQHFGDWQGRRWDELRQGSEEVYAAFWADPGNNTPPGGESFADLIARAGRAIDRLTARHAGRDIVAVAHGGTIRAALAHALGIDATMALGVVINSLSLTRIDHTGGQEWMGRGGLWRVATVNAELWRWS